MKIEKTRIHFSSDVFRVCLRRRRILRFQVIFKCTEGAGVGDARWVDRNAKLSISMILRKN